MRKSALGGLGAGLLATAVCVVSAQPSEPSQATPTAADTQGVLGPGLYVFQTRTRGSTCGDSERDGYVMSFFAAINGIPGSKTMTMELVNTPHFTRWTLKASDDGPLLGSSRIGTSSDGPESHFELKLDGDRWKGAGARTYNGKQDGKPARCRVDYDGLVRRIDVR